MQDAYVGRGSKEPVFVSANDQTIARALAAKANAVRRLTQQGRRAKFASPYAGQRASRGCAA